MNGALVTRLKLPPFIVTLGTLSIFTAIGLLYTRGQSVQAVDMPALLNWTGETFAIGRFRITTGVVLVAVLYVVVGLRAGQHRLGPTRVRGRRRQGGRRGWPASASTGFCSACTWWPARSTA